jgi:hypothetical protein
MEFITIQGCQEQLLCLKHRGRSVLNRPIGANLSEPAGMSLGGRFANDEANSFMPWLKDVLEIR